MMKYLHAQDYDGLLDFVKKNKFPEDEEDLGKKFMEKAFEGERLSKTASVNLT